VTSERHPGGSELKETEEKCTIKRRDSSEEHIRRRNSRDGKTENDLQGTRGKEKMRQTVNERNGGGGGMREERPRGAKKSGRRRPSISLRTGREDHQHKNNGGRQQRKFVKQIITRIFRNTGHMFELD